MISTDPIEDEDEDEDDSAEVLLEGLERLVAGQTEGMQRIADRIKVPVVNAPVTVHPAVRPKWMRVQGLYDGRTVDLTITFEP